MMHHDIIDIGLITRGTVLPRTLATRPGIEYQRQCSLTIDPTLFAEHLIRGRTLSGHQVETRNKNVLELHQDDLLKGRLFF